MALAPRSTTLSRGASPLPSPTPAAAPAPATTSPAQLPNASRSSPSSLSPLAPPFVPAGRTKSERWYGPSAVSREVSPPARPSFREVLLSRPVAAALEPKKILEAACPPSLRLSSEIGLCSLRPSAPGAGEWKTVESRRSRCRRLAQVLLHHGLDGRVDLRGRCFNCFAFSHHAAACRRPTRCFYCLDPGHLSFECLRWLTAMKRSSSSSARWLAWRPSQEAGAQDVAGACPSLSGGPEENAVVPQAQAGPPPWRHQVPLMT
jgi:hypothetical protein